LIGILTIAMFQFLQSSNFVKLLNVVHFCTKQMMIILCFQQCACTEKCFSDWLCVCWVWLVR